MLFQPTLDVFFSNNEIYLPKVLTSLSKNRASHCNQTPPLMERHGRRNVEKRTPWRSHRGFTIYLLYAWRTTIIHKSIFFAGILFFLIVFKSVQCNQNLRNEKIQNTLEQQWAAMFTQRAAFEKKIENF